MPVKPTTQEDAYSAKEGGALEGLRRALGG